MKSTKKSLFLSALSLMMCISMLLGTTYAWFTDTVTSGKNRIVSGNLDVEMYYKTQNDGADWLNVETVADGEDKFFVNVNGEKILWEPGVVSVCDFEIRNVGNLALKYKFNTEFEDGNDAGSTKKLSSVIKAAVVAADTDVSTREKAIEAGKAVDGGFQNIAVFASEGALAAKGKTIVNNTTHANFDDKDTFRVILYWEPTENDDDYNMNNEKQNDDHTNEMWINVDIKLIATQLTEEKDSFDINYDIDSKYPGNTASDAALILDPDDSGVVTGLPDGDTSETIIIPVTATKISDNAFKGNTNIKSVTMPVTTDIGEGAFDGCSNLTDVTLIVNDNETAIINADAFRNCENLETVNINGDCKLDSGSFSADYEHAWDSCDFVFNGNVEVGAFTFYSTGDKLGNSTVNFNGDVTFANANNIFLYSSVEQITFAAGKKIVIPGAIMTQISSMKRVVFEGAPADGSYISYDAFNDTPNFEGVYIECTKAEWLAVNGGGAAPSQKNAKTVNTLVKWKDPEITAEMKDDGTIDGVTEINQLPTVFSAASRIWTKSTYFRGEGDTFNHVFYAIWGSPAE